MRPNDIANIADEHATNPASDFSLLHVGPAASAAFTTTGEIAGITKHDHVPAPLRTAR